MSMVNATTSSSEDHQAIERVLGVGRKALRHAQRGSRKIAQEGKAARNPAGENYGPCLAQPARANGEVLGHRLESGAENVPDGHIADVQIFERAAGSTGPREEGDGGPKIGGLHWCDGRLDVP